MEAQNVYTLSQVKKEIKRMGYAAKMTRNSDFIYLRVLFSEDKTPVADRLFDDVESARQYEEKHKPLFCALTAWKGKVWEYGNSAADYRVVVR
jgi:hypothetical protein